jgi:hypothetical protein
MKETRDPPRLKLGAEGPLKDALSALETGAPSVESMAHMSERLSPWFQAPPPGPGLASLTKLGVLAVIAASTWVAWSSWHGSPPSTRAVPSSAAPVAQQPPTASAGGTAPASSAIQQQREPAAIDQPERAASVPSRSVKRSAPRRPVVSSARAGSAPATIAAHAAAPGPEPELPPAPQEPVTRETASSSVAAAAASVPDSRERVPVALDEAALLRKARSLAKDDPRAALQLVAEHERRFPSGMLVQERELLAVELLHTLSRERESRARLQAFRARFPDSIYLRRSAPSR